MGERGRGKVGVMVGDVEPWSGGLSREDRLRLVRNVAGVTAVLGAIAGAAMGALLGGLAALAEDHARRHHMPTLPPALVRERRDAFLARSRNGQAGTKP